ncbi:MAG: peptidyl-prolyl cis-trans isomerase [Psychrosphaera sp.]|nr:peptidyl-prolyl cis-trans isomerase [Psychrosphaera sp.]
MKMINNQWVSAQRLAAAFVLRVVLSVGLGVALSACSDTNTTETEAESVATSEVLATVQGEPITQDDLSGAILRTLGEYAALQLDQSGRKKVLESLVMAKAMAISQTATLDSEQQLELDRTVKAFREELLVKQYLKTNITPVPVSQAMVKTYYEKYPERFGGKTIRHYEIVKGLVKRQSQVQNALVEQLGQFGASDNWQQKVARLKQSGLQVQFAKGAADGSLLNPKFANAVAQLGTNNVSPLYFFDGYPTVIKVIKISKVRPKPLNEVSADIRKSLLPVQLKQAVKTAAAELLGTMNISYQ